MFTQPSDYLLVHPLPAAPHFVGRAAELEILRAATKNNFRGVVALTGLGGAGKTALAARFLEELAQNQPAPRGLFVWSFYQEPDAGLFLQRVYQYLAGPASSATPAKGVALIHLLAETLDTGGPYWLVLDGLERIQSQEAASGSAYGKVEDPLLRGLLIRIAGGLGQTVAFVTSRFPLTDLHPFLGSGYRQVEVEGLDPEAARLLLRSHAVHGSDTALDDLIAKYGAHALTLDHLGGLLGQFLDGNPQRAPEVAQLTDIAPDRQAFRLARLLLAYEEHLPPEELALLCRLCLLRRSLKEEHIFQFFLCAPPVHARTLREVSELTKRFPGLDQHFGEELRVDLAESVRATLEEALSAKPIAGPEETFRAEIVFVLEKFLEVHDKAMEIDFGELVHLYSDPALEHPSDSLPLEGADRVLLRSLYARYIDLNEHPLTPFQQPTAALEKAFAALGFSAKPAPKVRPDLNPGDVWTGLRRAKQGLRRLAAKHFALRRLRALCRSHQTKWSLAGRLASLDAPELRRVLAALIGRHLVLREADGTFSVHPAVRDHFHRLAGSLDQTAWHDVLREQLVTLTQRPGKRRPDDPATLDLAEEAIYHAQQAGRTAEALWLYNDVLGGLRHLAWKLGEMARGLRILRTFDPCPDRWSLAWFLRALGEFDEAFALNELPYFRADVRLLQGRLPEVAAIGDSARTASALFLMGKSTTMPPDQLGSAIPPEQLWIYQGHLDRVGRCANLDILYSDIGFEGDRARCRLLLAEAARRQANLAGCAQHLDAAAVWILHSGSVEHLALLHLLRARYARAVAQIYVAQRELHEGLHLTARCGLGLFHIELLCEHAECLLAQGDVLGAETQAREGLRRASDASCQFVWGAASAGHLLGQALIMQTRLGIQSRLGEAREVLQQTVELRHRIGDPATIATKSLLKDLGSSAGPIST